MTEETINYRIEYDIRGVDRSIRGTQRLLFFMNAVRLSVVDIQQVLRGPTISNVMWTAVQLTRVWTHLFRLIKATNQAQRVGVAQTLGGTAMRGAAAGAIARRFAIGQATLFGPVTQVGLFSSVMAFAAANPIVAGAIVTGVVVSGAAAWDFRQRRMRQEWIKRQREVAKSQGLVY